MEPQTIPPSREVEKPFDPRNIPGLINWYRADAVVTDKDGNFVSFVQLATPSIESAHFLSPNHGAMIEGKPQPSHE